MAALNPRLFPRAVMQEVSWSFIGAPFTSRVEFEKELREAQHGDAPAGWEPTDLIILAPEIQVQYMYWEADVQHQPTIVLRAAAGAFTGVELLFLLHNALVEQLRDMDHHFFEGLHLARPAKAGQAPLYRLAQGS